MTEIGNIWKNNERYIKLLSLIGRLSRLFAESEIPFLQYRVPENLFCKCLDAKNLSREDIAYDAILNQIGVGIKTFQLPNKSSNEKVAEFNRLAKNLVDLSNKDLAQTVATYRNNRINTANNLYGIQDQLYHIVGRRKNQFVIFDAPYELIDIDNIHGVKEREGGISFTDGKAEYNFNRSKSVLYQRFHISDNHLEVPVEIIEDPYMLLEQLLNEETAQLAQQPIQIKDYVILPLFSNRNGGIVPLKSGLNQWNAGGRKRDRDEVYVPIPKKLHLLHPDFFPSRDIPFNLILPNGDIISAKICQDNEKALMSNPNKALGKWLLRDIMKIPYGQLVTMEDLERLGFNSLMLKKVNDTTYNISISRIESYRDFITK